MEIRWFLSSLACAALLLGCPADDDDAGDDDTTAADDDTTAADDDAGDDDTGDDDTVVIDEACDDDGDYDAKIVRCDASHLSPIDLVLAGTGDAGAVQVVIGADGGYGAGPEVYLLDEPLSGVVLVEDGAVEIDGEVPESEAGWALAAGGDVDGDGAEDLVVGDEELGRAYVISGPITGDLVLAEASAILLGDAQDAAGCAVSGGGSIDGDAIADVVVGAERGDRVYVVYGPVVGEVDLDLTGASFAGPLGSDTGASVASDGDVDGDGFADVLIGADALDGTDDGTGGAYLLQGPVVGTLSAADATAKLLGEMSSSAAGRSVAFVGDLDGDGLDDLAVAAPNYDMENYGVGTVYVLYGPVTGDVELVAADAVIRGSHPNHGVGEDVDRAGDVNGDGLDDLLVGYPGSAMVFHGPVVGELESFHADRTLGCQAGAASCGWRVAGGRDLDGDGHDDILLGTSHSVGGNSLWRGAVYLHRGGP